ncbi:uncharacterized protein A4U43_C05F25580 [Asparagus officinalis]|uniref:Uncharacterized protein n=1 Tax=Asparagus officinalis TaxID=4686 RepID=A0A5P1EUF8_ASPOF|nr:uncharacterized protein A4U43_C05F25580 [Asparagus officinalis]
MSFPSGISIVLPVVPKGTASNRVDNDEKHKEDDVQDRDLLPIILDVGEDTSLARFTIVTEGVGIVVPDWAVGVVGGESICGLVPYSCALSPVAIPLKPLANLAINQTAPDLPPILGALDPLLQPVGVVPEPVLLVASPGDNLAGSLVGDDEGEDGEAEEEDDEEEHDEEVDPEEEGVAAAGADEAAEGDDEEEDADGDDGGLQELLAVGGGAVGEPDAAGEDRDREDEDDQVQDPDEVVAQAERHCFVLLMREGS